MCLKERKIIGYRIHVRKPFVLFHIPAPSEVDVVVIGMTSKREIRLLRSRHDVDEKRRISRYDVARVT